MTKAKYSLVVCCYNEEKYLRQCLQSLVDQNFDKSEYELIIIDNESKDRTPEIAQSFTNVDTRELDIKYFRIKHVGLTTSRNFAIQKSTGDIIIFIDGDAVADLDLLMEYSSVFNDETVDFSGGRINLLNKDNLIARLLQNTRYRQEFFGSRQQNHFHGANMAFRKKIFDEFQFIENFYSRGDESSLYTLIHRKYKYAPAVKAIVYHERPEHILELLKLTFMELGQSYKVATLVKQVSGENDNSYWKSVVSNLLIASSLLLVLAHWAFIFPASLFILRFKRRIFHKYGSISEFIFSITFNIIQIVLIPPVYLYSYIKYKNEKLVPKVKVSCLDCHD